MSILSSYINKFEDFFKSFTLMKPVRPPIYTNPYFLVRQNSRLVDRTSNTVTIRVNGTRMYLLLREKSRLTDRTTTNLFYGRR